ncbi:MAG: DUF1566 domain-containing protein [Nitrospinaceae bacterium]
MTASTVPIKKLLVVCSILMGTLAWASPSPADPFFPMQSIRSDDDRFIDNEDGTITDTKTGLMWMKQESYQQTGHWITWMESFDFIKKANEKGFANYYDWQMPTLKDLKTLHEPHKTNSQQVGREMKIHIDPIFAKEGSGAWWALEANGHFNAFGIEFNNGKRFSAPKKSKARKAVRPMRVVKP